MFRVAVIGCGHIGNAHAGAWSRIPDVELCYVVDKKPEKAQQLAEQYGCKWAIDASSLPEDIDCVSVATPPKLHYPIVRALLMAGRNVFCEKPLTLNVAKGQELCELAKQKGVKLAVGFKMRFEPIFQKAKELYPLIGDPISIVTTKCQAFAANPDKAWVKDSGAMYELSVHDFDLISYISGLEPEEVVYAKMSHRWKWQAEDSFNIVAKYTGGVLANLQGCYCTSTVFQYRDLTITFLGENGYIRIERPDRIVVHTDHYEVVEIPASTVNTFDVELAHFMHHIQGLEPNPIPAEDAVRATRFIEAARAAGGDFELR